MCGCARTTAGVFAYVLRVYPLKAQYLHTCGMLCSANAASTCTNLSTLHRSHRWQRRQKVSQASLLQCSTNNPSLDVLAALLCVSVSVHARVHTFADETRCDARALAAIRLQVQTANRHRDTQRDDTTSHMCASVCGIRSMPCMRNGGAFAKRKMSTTLDALLHATIATHLRMRNSLAFRGLRQRS